MPCHNELYTGRDDYLEKLRTVVSSPGPIPSQKDLPCFGMGGAGKTQICLKFAEAIQNGERQPFVSCGMLSYDLGQILANFLA